MQGKICVRCNAVVTVVSKAPEANLLFSLSRIPNSATYIFLQCSAEDEASEPSIEVSPPGYLSSKIVSRGYSRKVRYHSPTYYWYWTNVLRIRWRETGSWYITCRGQDNWHFLTSEKIRPILACAAKASVPLTILQDVEICAYWYFLYASTDQNAK